MDWKKWQCLNCDLDLGDMSLSQGHDTIMWYIIKIQLGSDNFWPGHGFGYVCTATMTLEIWPWVKVMTHPSVIDNNYVKYYPRSNLAVMSDGLDTDFWYMCTVTLTLEICYWVKVMTHPWVMDNNCVKYYPDPTWHRGVMARTRISSICALWPWPWRYVIGSRSWHTLRSWTTIMWNIIQIQLASYLQGVIARTGLSSMCALWPWPWRYDRGSRSWHTVGSWTTIMWNNI